MSDAARLLRLLSLLQTPREWPGSELAGRLGVTPRTVRRYIDRLRDLGYPVEASLGVLGGYRLVAGTAMPPLLLDDEEAVAVAVALRASAGGALAGIEETSVRALVKLEQMLPSRLRHRIDALRRFTVGNGLDFQRMQFAELGNLVERQSSIVDKPDGCRFRHEQLLSHGYSPSVRPRRCRGRGINH